MQAITVKFFGPGNVRGSRYKASCAAGSLTVQANDAINAAQNRRAAANALRAKLGWTVETHGALIEGTLDNGQSVFVMAGRCPTQKSALDGAAVACRIAVNYTESHVPQPRGPEERHLHAAANTALQLIKEAQ